jgi:cell division protein FtsL
VFKWFLFYSTVALVLIWVTVTYVPPSNPVQQDIPSLREQLKEQERVRKRYKDDFYELVTTVRS